MTALDPGAPRPAGFLAKLLSAEPTDVGLFVEAALVLGLARVALAVTSLATVVDALAALSKALRATSDSRPEDPRRAAWAVDAASGRLGGRCLLRSVALQALLARRGLPSEICVAFRPQEQPLPGHAWVEVHGRPLGADGRAALAEHPSPYEILRRLPGA